MQAEIVLFDGFDELDVFGPWEVLAAAAQARTDISARLVTLEGAREVVADHGAIIRASGGLSERPDVLVVPGGGWFDHRAGYGVWGYAQAGELPAAIAACRGAGTLVASICTGALLLAHAGVLAGHRATTNPRALDDLRQFPGVDVVAGRVVDDGDILTAGAPACGLDLALRLLERHGGRELSMAAQQELQYEPPPNTVNVAPT